MLSSASLIPKVLVALLFLGIFYQLATYSSSPRLAEPHLATPGESNGGASGFSDAIKPHPSENDEDNSPTLIQKPKPSPGQDAFEASPTSKPVKPSTGEAGGVDYEKLHISYGPTQCMPRFTDELKKLAVSRKQSCIKHAPFPASESRRVAFASTTTGKPEDAYQRAILSQMLHNAVHGTTTHVLCEQLSEGAWNKIAYLLNLVMNEMLKPKSQRTEWMMWIDRDAIVLDSCRPLSMFVPPATAEFEKVNLITSIDATGLNAGVFLFRIDEWSVSFFNTILAYRYYRPNEQLVLAEQTAMEKVIKEDKWKESVVRVPWYWFNSYPDEADSVTKYKDGIESVDLEWFRARKGDFVVHFAGDNDRSSRMSEWLDMLDKLGNVWEKGDIKRDITKEIEEYWNSWKAGTLTNHQITGEPDRL